MFRGTFTALVTPFRNGGIDVSAFETLIQTQIAAGITGLVAIGTTGESPTLSHEEREEVIRLTVATANKRCVVLAGTGSNATQHAVTDTKAAEKLGVDGALLVAPYYNKPSQEGLFRHFKAIAEATSLPIILYNIPGRCSVDITPETVGRLAKECRNIVSIKEASGSVERVSDLRRRLPEAWLRICSLPKYARSSAPVNQPTSNRRRNCIENCCRCLKICSSSQTQFR
jgi:4-hydroxy-tetrahydrodipicolinate synthase